MADFLKENHVEDKKKRIEEGFLTLLVLNEEQDAATLSGEQQMLAWDALLCQRKAFFF